MEFIRGLHNLKASHQGCVATIGNFDGVHLGHQAVLGQLSERAAEMGLPTVVILFEPQPQEFFVGAQAPARLSRLREKIKALLRYSVDRVLCLRFDAQFCALPAQDFIDRVLVQGLGVQYLVVGDDFRFGKHRQGDFAMLQAAGVRHGFQVVHMRTFAIDGERVSSTRVRDALMQGRMADAEKLMGRPYRICGRVAHGDKRGRTIDFPTANIFLHRQVAPVAGVFVIEMFGVPGEPIHGVANVGTRPTVDGTTRVLEAHLFDFDADIYGRHVHVDFLHKVRDEQRFASFEQLREQIKRDVICAKQYFEQRVQGDA